VPLRDSAIHEEGGRELVENPLGDEDFKAYSHLYHLLFVTLNIEA